MKRPPWETDPPPVWARAAAVLYGAGAALHRGVYAAGLRASIRLPVPVVSVGNLAVGGTGKTPAVRALAEAALRAGRRPAILTRGYGGTRAGILRSGAWSGGPARAAEAGDEPLWLSRALPGVPVGVGPDRAASGRALLAAGETVDVFLLDDGFQHRRLARDADLVLVDAAAPFGNGRLLPAGRLRERPAALSRAAVILAAGASGKVPAATRSLLARVAPRAEILGARPRPGPLRRLGEEGAAPDPRGLAVRAVAGIARPERLAESLAEAGARVVALSRYPDHHRFGAAEARSEERAAAAVGARPVTTAKDAVRLEGVADPEGGWLVLEIVLEVEGGWDRLWSRLTSPPG